MDEAGTTQETAARVVVNVSIDVPDLEAGVRFYCEVFGWVERSRPFSAMAVLDGNNVKVCIHSKSAGSKPTPADVERGYERHWTPVHLDFHVEDFDEVLEKAKSAGATIEQIYREPKAAAFCADPFGNGFCIIGP